MTTLLWQRDLAGDAAGVKNTFSSWDQCMTKAYCKWPVIVGIIIGSLIVLSVIWCLARCLCCGAECCCGCLACCNACCPSPRKRNQGYQQPPPQPYQQYPQYQSPQPPMYAWGGYRGPQTATFDAPSKSAGENRYNEDALPAMPSWDHAASKRVENDDEVEMEKLNNPNEAQQQSLLPRTDDHSANGYYGNTQHQEYNQSGDIGNMHASPYHSYDQHQQYAPSPISTAYDRNSAYPPSSHYMSPTSTVYEPSTYPPSYHTAPPSQQIGRKPVQGTWRDV